MPTPNKENVEKMMRGFQKALSENDVEFLVSMAQEEEPSIHSADVEGAHQPLFDPADPLVTNTKTTQNSKH